MLFKQHLNNETKEKGPMTSKDSKIGTEEGDGGREETM